MTKGSKTKEYTSFFYYNGVGTIFHRNVDWGHANLELQVFKVFMNQPLLLASIYLSSSGERIVGVEREYGEYTWRRVLRKWREKCA
jgi:hypothetical protein